MLNYFFLNTKFRSQTLDFAIISGQDTFPKEIVVDIVSTTLKASIPAAEISHNSKKISVEEFNNLNCEKFLLTNSSKLKKPFNQHSPRAGY